MVEEPALDRVVKSPDRSQASAAGAACSVGTGDPQQAQKIALAERLIDGDFSADEQPEGDLFVSLFQDLSQALAKHKTEEEI